MPHELERGNKEDEDQLANEQFDKPESVQHFEDDALTLVNQDLSMEEEEQRRKDLNIGRPRTPEPSRLSPEVDPFLCHYHTSPLQSFVAPRQMTLERASFLAGFATACKDLHEGMV